MTHRTNPARKIDTKLVLALTFACVIPLGTQASEAPNAGDFYVNLYPEWTVRGYGAASSKGSDVGQMGTLRNDTPILATDAKAKSGTDDHEWSNSYIGIRGAFDFDRIRLGYDFQALIDLQGSFADNFRTRDAFVYAQDPLFGRLSLGQMDTVYKEAGDQVRMLGVSSGNIVSTAKLLSGVGWRARGATSFNNRTSHMANWVSPEWEAWTLALSYSVKAGETAPLKDARLTAAALQWQRGPWYAALATEVHHDWLPLSLGDPASMPAASSILNQPASTSSRDQGWRASVAWNNDAWRFGADLASLVYTETDAVALVGKFRSYRNITWQASAEYRLPSGLRLAANHVRASQGQCTLSADASCSTHGLGGFQTSLGSMYALNKVVSLFALSTITHNGAAAQYNSAPQGGSARNHAIGIKIAIR